MTLGKFLPSKTRSTSLNDFSCRVVYVWGYNGYCRLGLGNQVDALKPKVVPQFAGPNELTMARTIAAGPTNSIVVDKQGMFWMAGKVRMKNLISTRRDFITVEK